MDSFEDYSMYYNMFQCTVTVIYFTYFFFFLSQACFLYIYQFIFVLEFVFKTESLGVFSGFPAALPFPGTNVFFFFIFII